MTQYDTKVTDAVTRCGGINLRSTDTGNSVARYQPDVFDGAEWLLRECEDDRRRLGPAWCRQASPVVIGADGERLPETRRRLVRGRVTGDDAQAERERGGGGEGLRRRTNVTLRDDTVATEPTREECKTAVMWFV